MYAVLEGQEWLVVAGVGLVFVAGAWLPDFARSLTRARREYRRARREDGPPAPSSPPDASTVALSPVEATAVQAGDPPTAEVRSALVASPTALPALDSASPMVLTGGAFGGEEDAGTVVVPHRPAVPVVSRAAIGAVPLVLPSEAVEPPPGEEAGWEEGEWDGVTAGWTDDADPPRSVGRPATAEPARAHDGGEDEHPDPGPVVEDPHAAMWRRVDRITSERVAAPRSLLRPRRRPAARSRRDPTQP